MKRSLILLTLVGCSAGQVQSPAEDMTCTVEETPEGALVTCPDGTFVSMTNGDDGLPGEQGTTGLVGQNGESMGCSVTSDSGVSTIICEDGSTAVLQDGLDGRDGVQGDPGTNGLNGLTGAAGEDGTSCTVGPTSQGAKTVSCTDGTFSVLTDGAKGDQGDTGIHCWDLNGNATCDLGSEDIDGSGGCGPSDCTGVQGPAGDSCTVTDNGDGLVILQCGAELARLTKLPSGTFEGMLSIQNSADLRSLDGYSSANDSVVLLDGVTDMTNSLLSDISGDLIVNSTTVTTFSLSGLTAVSGNLTITDTQLALVDLSSLDVVGGDLTIVDNTLLPACAAQALADQLTILGGTFTNTGNDATGVCN